MQNPRIRPFAIYKYVHALRSLGPVINQSNMYPLSGDLLFQSFNGAHPCDPSRNDVELQMSVLKLRCDTRSLLVVVLPR